MGRVKLLKKWREFSEGGNGYGFFLRKGKPPPIEQSRSRAGAGLHGRQGSRQSRRQSRSRASGSRSRSRASGSRQQAAGSRQQAAGSRQQGIFIFHWKLFPSFAIIRLKYQSKNNNINLSVFNILYE